MYNNLYILVQYKNNKTFNFYYWKNVYLETAVDVGTAYKLPVH